MSETRVRVGGRVLKLSNLQKVLYPEVGFTKAQVIDYYMRAARFVLPHVKNRPLTLKRYPEGVDRPFFYEKRCPVYRPEWVKTAPVWSERSGDEIPYCLVNDLPSLIWAANLADLELHTSLSLARDIRRPNMLVFDLDPGAPADILQCCEVGLHLKELFDRLDLRSFPKTSGSKGLQIYVPLNTPVTYDQTKPFAHAVAQYLEAKLPKLVVSQMKKSLRAGKVFVDWSQNDEHKTTVCVYSLRARARPIVSTPVTWPEVENATRESMVFNSEAALSRADASGDLFEPVLKLRQRLPRYGREVTASALM